MRIILLFLFCSICSVVLSQQAVFQDTTKTIMDNDSLTSEIHTSQQSVSSPTGEIVYTVDDRFEVLLNDYVSAKKIQGYRIQLFSGRSRWDAIKVKSDFLGKYENHQIYLSYQQPNFKLRAGNYRDKLSATKNLAAYKIDFPSAFIVSDEIEVTPEK